VGTGVGLEFLYKQNFDIRCDWGVALNDIRSGATTEVESGSNRFHISATLLY
jgi:hemolysin activation/secretion protein